MPPKAPKAQFPEPDWNLIRQKKPSLSLEHINDIAELASIYLQPEAAEFSEDDILPRMQSLYELSRQQPTKMSRKDSKKLERIILSAFVASAQVQHVHQQQKVHHWASGAFRRHRGISESAMSGAKSDNLCLIDAGYLISLFKSGRPIKETLERLLAKADVIIPTQVLGELQSHKFRQVAPSKKVAELTNAIYEIRASSPRGEWLMLEEAKLDKEYSGQLAGKLRRLSPKHNSRVGKGDAALCWLAKEFSDLYKKMTILSSDSDLPYLVSGMKNVSVLPAL